MQESEFKFKFDRSLVLFALILCSTSSHSKCTEDHTAKSYYSIQCSASIPSNEEEIKVHLFVERDVKFVVHCRNMRTYNDLEELLPPCHQDLGNFIKVEIINCPLAHHVSLGKIIQSMGIQKYKSLHYVNHNMSTGMKKETLQDIDEKLQKLVLEIKPSLAAPQDLFSDKSLHHLRHLYLYGDFTTMHSNLFRNLKNLLALHIETNLKCLPRNLLQPLARLKRLTLANNQLDECPLTITSFTLLYLGMRNNSLKTLHAHSLKELANVKTIEFANNSFRSLPEGLFEGNKHLERLYFVQKSEALKHLPNAFLADLFRLQEVTIECNLERVPYDLFKNSSTISKISMAHNKLQHLPTEIFQHQVQLRYLDLSHNNLPNLSEHLFDTLKELIELKLGHNNLKHVASHLFLPLRRMRLLDVGSNQLTAFVAMPFDGDMQTLIIRNNSLTSMFSVQMNVSSKLRRLDLSYNQINHIKSKHLELIFASDLYLDLRHNRIQTIDLAGHGTRTSWNGRSLQVNLNFNPLTCDCHIMVFMKYLANERDGLKFKVDQLKCHSSSFLTGRFVRGLTVDGLLCPELRECPRECNECWRRPYDKTLIVNCTNRNLMVVPNLPDIQKLSLKHMELFLENNHISLLPPRNTTGYESVSILNMEYNNLSSVANTQLPPGLVALNVKNNRLESLNGTMLLKSLKLLRNVKMLGNPFTCLCDSKSLWHFVHNNSRIFEDYANMTCVNSHLHRINLLNFYESCHHKVHIPVTAIAIACSIACLAFGLYHKYEQEVKVYLFSQKYFQWLVAHYDSNEDQFYDAFLAYSATDELFVTQHLAPGLENSSPWTYKLCIPSRDWLLGDCIPDQIVHAIDNSKRTIFVLSPSFIRSVWSKLEFKYAHQAGLSEGKNKIILVMYEDIGDTDDLDPSLKAYLKTQSYLKCSDKRFWIKLRFAMPHRKPRAYGSFVRDIEL